MRIKTIWILVFVAVILIISSYTLYFYVEKRIDQWVELRLLNWADNVLIDIEKDQDRFLKDPAKFLYSSTGNEYISSGIIVQFQDMNGRILAKSPGLKRYSLPFTKSEDNILKDVEMQDGTDLKTYQRLIEFGDKDLGYLIVGVPTSQLYHTVNTLRIILAIVMFCTILILGFGISSIVSLGYISDQRKFLSYVSHELRTPLSVISGHTEVALMQGGMSPVCKEALQTIKVESDWMNRMVSNLLTVFRGQSGVQKVRKAEFDIGELLIECISSIKKLFPLKSIVLNISGGSRIYADRDLIKRLAMNLLENAAHYTSEKGEIRINISSTNKMIELSVKDNGVGIKKEQQKDIFNAFYQVEQGKGGVGLGLTIAKWIVNAHSGTIKVESEEGKGTVFTVQLPR